MEQDFETLFRTAFPKLVALGLLKTGRGDVARELAQETLLRAHERWADVGGYRSPEAWCRTVMAHLLIDHHRSQASQQRAIERLSEQGCDYVDESAHTVRWNELTRTLSEQQRLIVTLHYAEDWSIAQIAAATATTQASVKAMLFKARRTLRQQLEREERRHAQPCR